MTALPELKLSSVAKYSLFSTPIVSFFLRTMRAVPVAKTYDPGLPPNKQPSQAERRAMNAAMFKTVEDRLAEGVNIVIFPEGTCHSTYEIKELKSGTARMALEIAAAGGPRVPIIPVGLSYSSKSGVEFRSKVLVDIGKPIEINEVLEKYKTGDKNEVHAVVDEITERLEGNLRHVTINSPSWIDQLDELVASRGLPPPAFRMVVTDAVDGKKGMSRCTLTVGEHTFVAESEIIGRAIDLERKVMQDAARQGYFTLIGAAGSEALVDTIRLARRIYMPSRVDLSLAQITALARNFVTASVRKLDDPAFQRLYSEVKQYDAELRALGISDQYVAMHTVGTDPLNERLRALRRMARLDLLKTAVMAPLSAMGTVTHAPVAAAGSGAGVEADGDKSVEATMRVISGFVSLAVLYPTAAFTVAWVSGSGWAVAPTMALLATSGYAAATRPIWKETAQSMFGSLKILTNRDMVDRLREKRQRMQLEIRKFADENAPALEMKGWWLDPEQYTATLKDTLRETEEESRKERLAVTPESISDAALAHHYIPLRENKRHPKEVAVLTSKQWPGNKNALVWIPGRNDSFFHVHILDRLLEAGFDLHALDLRRCGRAQFSVDGERVNDELLAHDSHDFREYFEEIDATLKWLKNPRDLPNSTFLVHGGCGKVYENIVMYSHSTGGLVAALYGADRGGAWRGAIDGFIFNSPFWTWNVAMYERVIIENASKVGIPPDVILSEGGGPSMYAHMLHETYGFGPELKNLRELSVTAGWCRAVTDVQTRLQNEELQLQKPTLVLTTKADEVLDADDVKRKNAKMSKDGTVGRHSPIWSSDLVQREIETDSRNKSA
eukprot:CAMPEP_0206293804 /NCGR_PEP_ID=MMETSP0106_2-20121207/4325_1 /ASSEMBLY_ACC=CAM_ASM_000206 /TAXON_ID=81532 /ORGANISM="Acanthoeca-like sp., Strain 10tr" /LENGTH=838 /DNA_ID=CAMNT_0053724409 /DNA_START=240 /DNA_END=2753 /DNA_ORIENTATION=-